LNPWFVTFLGAAELALPEMLQQWLLEGADVEVPWASWMISGLF
jgi:hypothetical protein